MKALIRILTFAIIVASSQAETLESQPQQAPELFNLNETLQKNLRGSCSYTATIATSCSSPTRTRDQISLAFGDEYGYQFGDDNLVYAPRLDDPSSGTFASCSADTFKIRGPCTYQICYLYLYRIGPDGWKPQQVTVSGTYSKPVTFNFNTFIPDDLWYGFNSCPRYSSPSSSATA